MMELADIKNRKDILKHIIDYEYFLKNYALSIYEEYNDFVALVFLKEAAVNPVIPSYWSSELVNLIKNHVNE